MTTIAWDGNTLAADSQGTFGATKSTTKKIFQISDVICAFTGDMECGLRFLNWVQQGMDMENFPEFKRSAEEESNLFHGIVVQEGRAYQFSEAGVGIPIDAPHAWGSGASFAFSALDMGKGAVEAVKAAARRDVYTGGKVVSYSIQEKKKRKKK